MTEKEKTREDLLERLNEVTRILDKKTADKKCAVKAYNEDISAYKEEIKDVLKDMDELQKA